MEMRCPFTEVINTDDISMALTREPFKGQVDDVPAELQEEFLELVHNSSVKDESNSEA